MTPPHHAPTITHPHHSPGITPPHHALGITPTYHAPGITPTHHAPGITPTHHAPCLTPTHHAPGLTPTHHALSIKHYLSNSYATCFRPDIIPGRIVIKFVMSSSPTITKDISVDIEKKLLSTTIIYVLTTI